MFARIKERYDKGFITEEQLERYVSLNVLTEEEYHKIKDR
jgi:uncharacterized membrane protein